MNLLNNSQYYPLALDTIEKQTVFNLEALYKGIYENQASNVYPHSFVEAESVYGAPVISKRIIPTPEHGTRMIYVVAFPIAPGAGFDASGIWNHVIPMAPNLNL